MLHLIQTMPQLQSIKKILKNSLFFILFGHCYSTAAEPIGDITENTGSNIIKRLDGSQIEASLTKDIVEFQDTLETINGRMKVMFKDETKLSLTEHSEVFIDEYYFDPNPKKSKMAMNFIQGTARFATGRLGLVAKENIVITTPTATIGVRGTDFTTTVDELGRSLVILLPETECTIDGDCSPSGEITVTNDGGQVILSEAYAATMVSSFDSAPIQPVILENLTMNIIDNMFIVSPPKEIERIEEETSTTNTSTDILDFNDLDINYLNEDWLEEEEDLEYNELDINYLDGDFLQNVLDDIGLSQEFLKEASQNAGSASVQGTLIGYDAITGYYTTIDTGSDELKFYRIVNGYISIKTSITRNITLESENEGKKNFITNGDGQSVNIRIRQGG